MPYYTLGYPDLKSSMSIIEAISTESDLIELGMPFSDPIADGPTIQRSTQRALEGGMTTTRCLEALRELRQRGVQTPALLMGYYNPIFSYGEERFAADCSAAGADGLIIPDLPVEESERLSRACHSEGMALIPFLAPTSSQKRMENVVGVARDFIYVVSVIGVTGARTSLPGDLPQFVARLKELTSVPVAVGFGISTPQQARAIGEIADGVIVGSAIIDAVDRSRNKSEAASAFVRSLRRALLLEDT